MQEIWSSQRNCQSFLAFSNRTKCVHKKKNSFPNEDKHVLGLLTLNTDKWLWESLFNTKWITDVYLPTNKTWTRKIKRETELNSHSITLLSVCGGGNGVYSFFLNLDFLTFFAFLRVNLGRNLSHDSFFNSGSLANSLLIISVCKEDSRRYDPRGYKT